MKLGNGVDRESSPDAATYTYAGMGYAQPNPVTTVHEVVIYGWTANVVQTLDYFPFGGLRISVSTSTNEKRKYIDQFSDDSGLSYLQARYYDAGRGQFLSQDPTFLDIGKSVLTNKVITNPQSLNSYGYANDNPIENKDPDGRFSVGVSYNGTLEGGFGVYSATYVSTNLNLVVDPKTRQVYVVQSNSGAVNSGYMNNYQSAPDNGKAPFVLGLFAGGGVALNLSPNLTNPNDIQGTKIA
jgi:RHS repeat-associated protein